MTRSIKFRAWDGKEIKFAKDGTHFFDSEGVFPDTIIEITSGQGWEWMQFTGLLDKNGKEIYEGDIVEWNGDPDGSNEFYRTPNGVYEVVWLWSGFHFRDTQKCKFVPKRGRIIGNIWENGDLLNK